MKDVEDVLQWNEAGNRKHLRALQRRRAEDVEYWRQRSGWFDDDETMKKYNSGVYDSYYQPDDDRRHSGRGIYGGHKALVQNTLKVLSVLVALGLCVLMCRAIMRRLGSEKKKDKKRSDSKTRSGSSKRGTRSRSRSRSRKGEYDLMDDEENKSRNSKRSSRSKSKTRRSSRSRSRPRSHSKPRREKETTEPILV
jgi:hypothetical protein